MKKIISMTCIGILIVSMLLSGCGNETSQDTDSDTISEDSLDSSEYSDTPSEIQEEVDIENAELTIGEGEVGIIETSTYPQSYLEECDQAGTVTELYYTIYLNSTDGETYDTFVYETGDATEEMKAVHKSAMVYLPYEYDENRQYDIMYLQHGMSGTQYTFLGRNDGTSYFAKLLDHMIKDELISPMIVVCPTITPQFQTESNDTGMIDSMCDEIVSILMPMVENRYSTYASSTDADGLKAARDHRIMAGFSMGGCTTWRMLWYQTEYFANYMPFSMIADPSFNSDISGTSEDMTNLLQSKGYTSSDFKVYSACGTEDYTNMHVRQQIAAFLEYEDLFTYTETNFAEGNLMYAEWPGHYHRYDESFSYFYTGLQKLLGDTTE